MVRVKDHEVAELVNEVTRLAKQLHSHGQLRECLAGVIKRFLDSKGLRE